MRSTLKITSAMKLVASSKLRRAQRAIEALRPYEDALAGILAQASGSGCAGASGSFGALAAAAQGPEKQGKGKTVILAFAGNSSMCGAFNSNAIKLALRTAAQAGGDMEFWSFGRKMTEALRKAGKAPSRVYDRLIANPSSSETAAISDELRAMYEAGEVGRIVLVYNSFISVGKQLAVARAFLPFGESPGQATTRHARSNRASQEGAFIFEPSRQGVLEALMPQVLQLRLYAALLDSIAAEHAARMVAMQAATDNGEELLSEITLEYNKGRQQKITAEILDLVAGEV